MRDLFRPIATARACKHVPYGLVTEDRDEARPVIRVDGAAELRLEHVQYSPALPGARAIELSDVGEVERDETEAHRLPPGMEAEPQAGMWPHSLLNASLELEQP